MSEPYNRKRTFYQNVSGNRQIIATDTGVVSLQTSKTSHTIYIQKLHIEITTGSAAKVWTFQDNNGTPLPVVPSIDASAIAHFDFDFGPFGIPLTEAKAFTVSVSAAGAVGWVAWEAYLFPSSPLTT